MRVVITTVGSHGDIHPFLAIGRALHQRGHLVTMICNNEFAALAERSGLAFASAGAGVSLDAAMANPMLWHPIKGLGVFWRSMLAPAIAPTFRHIERIAAAGPCIVIAPPQMFGARLARDLPGVRLISAITAPAVLRSDGAPLTMAHWRLPPGTPRWLVRGAWRALDKHKLHPMAGRTLQREAQALGAAVPPVDVSLFGEWMFSPDAIVTLFPEWFAPRRPGWPAALTFGDFPLFDDGTADAGAARLPDAVSHFLQRGEAPLVFMPGSAMRHARPFFDVAVKACAASGQRAILLTPDRTQLPAELPEHVLHHDYLPFAELLPKTRALVHHGGIGSCAQAMRAGIAQLVMPMAYDQFDNAENLRRLGVGHVLRPRKFDVRRLSAALSALRQTPADSLQRCRERLREPGLAGLCTQIEALA
ncbi:glycosyltransferase [Piscinibacter sakaiensis]|uniref:glycosyltransferase n=1 Tax=Piscinibacter sakaiensis TaxID=1547922 RepID=UPI003AB0F823